MAALAVGAANTPIPSILWDPTRQFIHRLSRLVDVQCLLSPSLSRTTEFLLVTLSCRYPHLFPPLQGRPIAQELRLHFLVQLLRILLSPSSPPSLHRAPRPSFVAVHRSCEEHQEHLRHFYHRPSLFVPLVVAPEAVVDFVRFADWAHSGQYFQEEDRKHHFSDPERSSRHVLVVFEICDHRYRRPGCHFVGAAGPMGLQSGRRGCEDSRLCRMGCLAGLLLACLLPVQSVTE